MRVRLILGWLVVLSVVAAIGYAQEPKPVRRLGLAEALDIARRNNPDYLTVVANRSPAAAQAFSAAMGLMTPTASINGGESWTQAGIYNLQGLSFPTPKTQGSAWNLSFGYILSGQTIANRGAAAAQLHAADQDIASSLTLLETTVRQEYLNLLEAKAQADLAEHVVAKAQEALNLAQARYSVGQNTMIDVKSAQVDKGTADVNLLQAQENVELEVLRLFRLLGVPAPEPARIVPTDTFPVVAPLWIQDSLVSMALAQNPVLLALRARASAAAWNTRAAYSSFAPSLQASASYGKFVQTSFDTTGRSTRTTGTSPWNFRIGFSLPIYEQFQRTSAVAQARASEDVLDLSIRARELQVRADVSSAYVLLDTAYRTIAVQRDNQAAADEALSLATERYRVGSGSIIELLTARVTSETASTNYITAVYNYHKAIAALEQAVGRTLR